MTPVQTVDITLKSGLVATVELSEQLVKSVREAFSLAADENPTPFHVKLYLARAMQNAIEKV